MPYSMGLSLRTTNGSKISRKAFGLTWNVALESGGLLVGDEIKTGLTGDFLMVPRNTRHAFRVDSETARFLNGYTPASLEAALVEFATPATERVLPPKGASPSIKMTPELLKRYGMDMLPGPDPLRPEGAVGTAA